MQLKFKKIIAMLLAVTVISSTFAGCKKEEIPVWEPFIDPDGEIEEDYVIPDPVYTNIPEGYGLKENIEDGTILHCFSWSFKAINESMEEIAASGFSTIQTSPINLCYDSGAKTNKLSGEDGWAVQYQPVDWTIGNHQLGTKEEFIEMCTVAESLGIKVIVDVVPNHTANDTTKLSDAFLEAVGGIDKLYHSKGLEIAESSTDRSQTTLMSANGYNDVNTENPAYQDYFIKFLNDCIECGADGFRYDSASYIGLPDDPQDNSSQANNFWERVTTEINNADKIFNYGAIFQGDIAKTEAYIDAIGAATVGVYGHNLRNAITSKELKADVIKNLTVREGSNVITWIESHDAYTQSGGTSTTLTNNQAIMGYAIIAARAEGTPLFFSRPYGAERNETYGDFDTVGMVGDTAYFKNKTVVAINRFRNAVAGEGENIFNADDNNSVLFIERGTKGLVIANAAASSYDFAAKTTLPDGAYVDRVDKKTTYVVRKGVITGTIAKSSVIILCNDGFADTKALATVKVIDNTTGQVLSEPKALRLLAANIKSATYSIDGGEEIPFTDGTAITLGETLEPLQSSTLTLKGTNEEGKVTTVTYIFTRIQPVKAGTVIHFQKPDTWKDDIHVYIQELFANGAKHENAEYPGEPMTQNPDGTYTYVFHEDYDLPYLLFNDSINKPTEGLGLSVEDGKLYTIDDYKK